MKVKDQRINCRSQQSAVGLWKDSGIEKINLMELELSESTG
jgi:hypothetical protein